MHNNSLDTLETGLVLTASFFGGELSGDIGVVVQIIAGCFAIYKMIEIARNWRFNGEKRREEREEHAIKMQKHKLEIKQLEQQLQNKNKD